MWTHTKKDIPVCIVKMINEEPRIHVASSQTQTSPPVSLELVEFNMFQSILLLWFSIGS